jgi:hypothetical protein
MIFKIVMAVDTELYEKEFGIKITDPDTMVKNLVSGMLPPGTKSVIVTVEK